MDYMSREANVEIFKDTEKLIHTNKKLIESVKMSTELQKLIREEDKVMLPSMNKYENDARVIVSKKRTLEAASAYGQLRTVVHNFASASNSGGGVVHGASAQEECLCRCSGLYFNLNAQSMWGGFYRPHRLTHNPIHNSDIIYTPAVIVFKSDTANPVLLPEKDWYDVDVITCAAPNLRENPSNGYNQGDSNTRVRLSDKELLEIHEKRLRRILDVAVAQGDEVIILGAFGCGAFKNKPDIVALAAKNVIKDYVKAFKVIEFAVYCNPRDDTNYEIFQRVINQSRS